MMLAEQSHPTRSHKLTVEKFVLPRLNCELTVKFIYDGIQLVPDDEDLSTDEKQE